MTFQEAIALNARQKFALAKMVKEMGVKMSVGESYTDQLLTIRYARQIQKLLDVQFSTEDYSLEVINNAVNKMTLYLGTNLTADPSTTVSYREVNANGELLVNDTTLSFLQLIDVNFGGTYTGKAGQVVVVNESESGLTTTTMTGGGGDGTGGAVSSVNGQTGVVVLTKSDVGLGNVTNTSDVSKPVSTAQQAALDLKVDKVTGKGLSTEDYTSTEKTKLSGIATGATANDTDANLKNRSNHTGTQTASTISDFSTAVTTAMTASMANKVDKVAGKQLSTEDYTTAEKTKLLGIATGATVNDTDANLKARANHTGTQTASTISDFSTAVTTAMTTPMADKVDKVAGKQLSTEDYTTTEKTKLAGIATGATANSADATLLARANHTGTQLASSISDFITAVREALSAGTGIDYDSETGVISATGGGGEPTDAGLPYTLPVTLGGETQSIGMDSTPTSGSTNAVTSHGIYVALSEKIGLASDISTYSAGANIALAPTDSLIAALGKLQGQINARGIGSVTSVGLSLPAGLSVSTGTITSSGTFTVSYASGYSLPTTTDQGNWTAAYLWGDHSTQNYIKLSTPLTGYTTGSNTSISATDTVLQAFGKIQAQINAGISGGGGVTVDADPTEDSTNAVSSGGVFDALAAKADLAAVINQALTGYATGSNLPLSATDTILQAFGKLQAQLEAGGTALAGKENTITAGTTGQYYRGDKSWQTLDKAAVGLSNVDNTSDANKPVSTATQTALDAKQATISTGTTSQYYRGDKSWQTLDKTAVGLANVDNTTDANKPVSTATQTALDAKSNLNLTLNDRTASYTLVLTDNGKLIRMNVASANNLTVPPNSSVAFPTGTQILVSQLGAGQTTFVPGSGVTIQSSGAKLKLTGQYSTASLIKVGTDTWLLAGDIAT